MSEFVESYKRPCFATCAKCGKAGVIVFSDGSQLGPVLTKKAGQETVRQLVASGELSPENGQRVVDQLVCSGLPQDGEEIVASADMSILYVVITTLLGLIPDRGSQNPNAGGDEHHSVTS